MNESELKKARKICKAATGVEWKYVAHLDGIYKNPKRSKLGGTSYDCKICGMPEEYDEEYDLASANAKFICYARTALPKALDEIEKLLAQNKIMVEALTELSKLGNGENLGNSVGNVVAQQALTRVHEPEK